MAALLVALTAGCASSPTMRSDVVRFHEWRADAPLSFAIRAPEPLTGSLERRSHEQRVRERLIALGFVEADAAGARYQVAMEIRLVSEPQQVIEYWPAPGPWPGYGWGPGLWIGPRMSHPWRYTPWWGMPPPAIAYDATRVRHEVRIDLFDVRLEPAPGRKVWESRAVAYAMTESTARLVPGLIEAAFTGFPGDNGVTRHLDVLLPAPPK